jgi:hypothetical protein
MESLLFMIAADIVISSALTGYQLRAREKIITRWKEGTLSMPELLWLKRQVWFRTVYLKKLKVSIDKEKKDN